ncbi:hypothetical protein AVEN_113926-1 [Araneus ventricosus]|uniref:Uncharacterized protein n=1 Tax=Araneus ventricosus TaxID=182803 RepID=A0A4Y2S833_ARAVE|nr:hypothetical protein AVEN_113926-1 [Araneus ventricosus]
MVKTVQKQDNGESHLILEYSGKHEAQDTGIRLLSIPDLHTMENNFGFCCLKLMVGGKGTNVPRIRSHNQQ